MRTPPVKASPMFSDYQSRKICAKIEQDIVGLKQTLRSEPTSLMVTAAITAEEVNVDIILSSPRGISFGANMKSTSLTVGIDISKEPYLCIIAGFAIKVAGQSDPLAFNLELKASDKGVVGSASIETDWHNPFEISPAVTVLHPVALEAEIDYALMETGIYPSRLDFTAGLQVGEVFGRAALAISENPSSGVVQVEVDKLSLNDIINFTNAVLHAGIPTVHGDPFVIQKMLLGLSSGASIDNVYYPPGVTFAADIEIFGKKARLASEINKTIPGIKMSGSIEAFQFGALAVKGVTGADPTLDVIIGPGAQHLHVDGEIDLFDSSISIHLLADIAPKFNVTFDSSLKFANLFEFDVHAEATDSSDSHGSDFVFSATMHQQILDYLVAHANTYILTAKHAADDGLENAKNTLSHAEQEYNATITRAQASLDEMQKKWNERRDRDTQRSNQTKVDAAEKRKRLEKEVTDAKKALDNAILALEKDLENVKEKAASRIRDLIETAS
ncbi:hypothetical protein AX17_005884 [Amanita inopinata Kibby_2008]|nr:hypothetical protein AX17_005884 [Amanita inopinata Kibby_2008]